MKSVTFFTVAVSVAMAVTLFCSDSLQAQDRRAKRGDVIRVRITRGRGSAHPGDPSRLSKGWLEGELVEIRPDSVVLLTKGTNFLYALNRDEADEIQVRYELSGGQAFWRGAKKGFIFGAVPGALTGLALSALGQALGDDPDPLVWAVGGALVVGVPAGALFGGIGAAGGRHAWSPARFSVRASPTVSSRPGLSVSASFRF